jgi:hypothetical protein
MNLPIIQTPTYELKLISIDEPVEYRPFLVKEEKLLLTAMEGNDPNEVIRAVKQILINCTITEIDVESLPTFDMEYLFLNIRSKSIGETSDIIINCQTCEEGIPISIELDDIKPTMDESHTPQIKLNDELTIEMKYPTMQNITQFSQEETSTEQTFKMIEESIFAIYDSENVYYLEDFPKSESEKFINSLTQEQFLSIANFFNTMPTLTKEVEYTCNKCDTSNTMILSGLQSFFE